MGREKWGEKSGARKVELRNVGRGNWVEMWRKKWGEKSGRGKWVEDIENSLATNVGLKKWRREKWDEKSGGKKSGTRKVG